MLLLDSMSSCALEDSPVLARAKSIKDINEIGSLSRNTCDASFRGLTRAFVPAPNF